ncbi:MAG: O-antigen ligase family protein [Methylobacter sp.]|uniref:O-antigen ligase family protein n=1 Tax=Methylobacter sp. TaxID=2051955 RepID=UPI0025EBC910|nr:O-antigen ligase family protein [Methylobacter sp.]MCK9623050.1 O-antigen ligase family protein [Methylobacter sp.]
MTLGQVITLGPIHLPPLRIFLAIGLVRVIIRGERLADQMNSLDWLMIIWGVWALLSSLFHKDPSGVLVNRLGLVYNGCGVYFLLRVICQTLDDVVRLCRITAILLIPLAIEMLFEKMTGHNLFSVLGGVSEISEVRNGRVRAQGPFAHSILAGTVGAVCLPLMIVLWQQRRKTAIAGIAACLLIIFASASSGPIMSALFAIGALLMWHWRQQMRLVRWFFVVGYIGLDIVMKVPAYYIISHIDLTGSSTSWHRAALIDTALKHISEWWFAGTDFTRHWMVSGVQWSKDHVDITNYYLRMGVDGGLPLMFLFIAILTKGFSFVGQALQQAAALPSSSQFMIWALGASLFSHAATFISVSYFDQTFVFLYLTLAAISGVCVKGDPLIVSKEPHISTRALPRRESFYRTAKKRKN